MLIDRGKFAAKIFAVTVILAGVFFGLSYIAGMIGHDAVRNNAISSEIILKQEGTYPRFFNKSFMQKDNFTDALMIGGAMVDCSENRMERVLTCNVFYTEGSSPSESALSGLARLEAGQASYDDVGFTYARYWHGYLTVLKPMLVLTDIKGIRIVNYILLYSLFIIVCWLIYRKISLRVAVFFAISLIAVGFPIVPDTMQFCTCFYITFGGILWFLCQKRVQLRDRKILIVFYVIGAVTSFFDLLTTPVMTLGLTLPLVLLYREGNPGVRIVVKAACFWCAGYVILWSCKWILATAFTSENIIMDALTTIGERTAIISSENSIIYDHYRHIYYFFIIVFSLIPLIWLLLRRKLNTPPSNILTDSGLPFLLIGFIPVLWLILARNHSMVHLWFVWRIVSVIIFNYMISFDKLGVRNIFRKVKAASNS